jgi:nicotinate-nucleotide adenylyltransferase
VTAASPAPAVGVFGGTFDPIHIAHLAVAEAARDALGLGRVLFVPNRQPPHKPDQRVTPAADRLAMLEAAIAGNPAFEVSTIEIDRDGPSYTADTLEALRAERVEAGGSGELAFILSVEALAGIAGWHDPVRVLRLATLVVAPRDGSPDVDPAAIARLVPGADARVVMLDGPRMRLSASEIRALAAAGRSVRYLVPDAVAAYIGDHDLYNESRRMDRS